MLPDASGKEAWTHTGIKEGVRIFFIAHRAPTDRPTNRSATNRIPMGELHCAGPAESFASKKEKEAHRTRTHWPQLKRTTHRPTHAEEVPTSHRNAENQEVESLPRDAQHSVSGKTQHQTHLPSYRDLDRNRVTFTHLTDLFWDLRDNMQEAILLKTFLGLLSPQCDTSAIIILNVKHINTCQYQS